MNKTPEQLAKKWALDWHKDCDYPNPILEIRQEATKHIFLAGYQAAKEKYEARIKELEQAIIKSVDAMAGVQYDDENT